MECVLSLTVSLTFVSSVAKQKTDLNTSGFYDRTKTEIRGIQPACCDSGEKGRKADNRGSLMERCWYSPHFISVTSELTKQSDLILKDCWSYLLKSYLKPYLSPCCKIKKRRHLCCVRSNRATVNPGSDRMGPSFKHLERTPENLLTTPWDWSGSNAVMAAGPPVNYLLLASSFFHRNTDPYCLPASQQDTVTHMHIHRHVHPHTQTNTHTLSF